MSPRVMSLRLLPLGASIVLLTACASSEREATRTPTAESTRSTAPSTSSAAPAPPGPSTSPAPTTSASAAPAVQGATITIEGFGYAVPDSVAAGAQVQVVNNDGEAHTLTLRGGPSIVVPPRGATMTFTAPAEAGTYQIVCDFHGNMTAQLVVT